MNDNVNILVSKKNIIKLDVNNVRIQGEARKVRFVARKGAVVCRTKGLQAFKMHEAADGGYFAKQYGSTDFAQAKTPAKAFAEAVKTFWS
jgi:hypothetical protein